MNWVTNPTLPRSIGRKSHRLGMSWNTERTVSARSSVRLLQFGSSAQSPASASIIASSTSGSHTKWPGGLTATIADRNRLSRCIYA